MYALIKVVTKSTAAVFLCGGWFIISIAKVDYKLQRIPSILLFLSSP